MEDNRYYSNPPEDNPHYEDRGTAPMILGILSLIFSVSFSRLIGLVLGIIAVCLGSKYRYTNKEAKYGFVMGIIGICISAIALFAIFSLFGMAFLPFFWY